MSMDISYRDLEMRETVFSVQNRRKNTTDCQIFDNPFFIYIGRRNTYE